jgi:hypothetical protein
LKVTMTPQFALAQSIAHLDDATENITFERFDWALEDTWRGVGWALNALAREPAASLGMVAKGRIPAAGTLFALASRAAHPFDRDVLNRLETLRADLGSDALSDPMLGDHSAAVAQLVFDAGEFYDACVAQVRPAAVQQGYNAPSMAAHDERRAIQRRTILKFLGAGALLPLAACLGGRNEAEAVVQSPATAQNPAPPKGSAPDSPSTAVGPATIMAVSPLDAMQWPTSDPFLFCAHHVDEYPQGNADLGPAASLDGRLLGRDFDGRDNWNMYHGETVPGFPRHPHRGFETVTVVRTGMLDHADSMGASARYGGGDVQWLTAGGGIQHAEMFPLLNADRDNPLELFQIWLNLPAQDKMVDPYFTMLWREQIPRVQERDENGRSIELTISAGTYAEHTPPPPPPDSWASKVQSDLAIWSIRMQAGAQWTLPGTQPGTDRSLYLHVGAGARIGDTDVPNLQRVELAGNGSISIEAGTADVEILLLQGRPIAEPVARRGPFVMNTQAEIRQAYADYQQTGFGGWPWPGNDPVHGMENQRFARHMDGRTDVPG